jgi:hypothetical protein
LTPETQLLPAYLNAMISRGLGRLQDCAERAALRPVTGAVAQAAFQQWLSRRTAEDNRVEHEFVVFDAAMRIAEAERLPFSGKLVVVCFTFLHDTHPIRRVTESAIREAAAIDPELAAALRDQKQRQRIEHMQEGARNADLLLRELPHPHRPGKSVVDDAVRERCAAIIAHHDDWKLGKPHPLAADREALVCFEADALWPLHPLGVLADLERPGESGVPKDGNDQAEWRGQILNNLATLREYRENWAGTNEQFQDADSIFRTVEGHRIYREWAELWGF